jgi:sialate O-acetylesterase
MHGPTCTFWANLTSFSLKLGGTVPIGLVSDNWGGTRVEQWTTPASTAHCGHTSTGELYNAMIVPYSVGPMAVSGFTWYQGESDLGGSSAGVAPWGAANNNYVSAITLCLVCRRLALHLTQRYFLQSCTQTAMIEQWRKVFQVPSAFYAIVQVSPGAPNQHTSLGVL